MTTITLEIPKEIKTRVIDGYCKQHGYVAVTGKVEFMTRMIYEHIAEMVRHAETTSANDVLKEQLEAKQMEIETSYNLP